MEIEEIKVQKAKGKPNRKKRLLLSFLLLGISLTTFIAATYAWFSGIGVTLINQFEVEIKTNEDLEISLDGYTWGNSINISEDDIKDTAHGGLAYVGNTNSWVGEEGIIPVSSSGDCENGRLKIYSKESLQGTNGGYRLVSKRYNNLTTEEPFYVAFDIFLKNNNSQGGTYKKEYNFNDDEAVYLTDDSFVSAIASGATSYGVQNSVRVAFVQVGRINITDLVANTTPVINAVSSGSTDKYTPLSMESTNIYRSVIWEPNELSHDTKLINYYNEVCSGKALTSGKITYGGSCSSIANGVYTPTYTVKNTIASKDNVDIYDGLNGWGYNIQTDSDATTGLLQQTETYTDTMIKTYPTNDFFRIHPHSVTKIRVYVYLEGQDVDNYDLAAEDQEITVSFGFTKNSYENLDIDD